MSKMGKKSKKSKKSTITRKELIINQSGNFLCECLPENYEEMTDEEYDTFLVENAWEPFEYWEASEIGSNIANAADSLMMFLRQKGIEVKE